MNPGEQQSKRFDNSATFAVREISFQDMPEQVIAIARICEVEDLLKAGERWTGPVGIHER